MGTVKSVYLKLSIKNRPPYRLRADFEDGEFSRLYVPYPVANLKFSSTGDDGETFSAVDLEQRVMFFLGEGRTGPTETLWNGSDTITLLETVSNKDAFEPMYAVFKRGIFNSATDALHLGAILTKDEGIATMLAQKCKMQMASITLSPNAESHYKYLTIEKGEEIVGMHLLALHDLQITHQFCATRQAEMTGMIPYLKKWLEPLLPSNLVNICAGLSSQVDGIDNIRYWSRRYTECDPYREALSNEILLNNALQQKKLVHLEDLEAEFPLVPAGAKLQAVDSDNFLPKAFPKGRCLVSEFDGEISVVALKVPHDASRYFIYSGESLTNISSWHIANNANQSPKEPAEPAPSSSQKNNLADRGPGR